MATKTRTTNENNIAENTVEEDNVTKDAIAEAEPDTFVVLENINKSVNEISGETDKKNKLQKTSKRIFEASEKIPCKSLFFGKLTYTSPTNGARYIWNEYGSVSHIPFGELETMNNFKPNYLQKPYILINDAEVVEQFNLTSTYEQVANISKLEELFNTGDLELIRKKIKEAISVNQRDTVISKVRKMRVENKLVDINIIRILEEELKYNIG